MLSELCQNPYDNTGVQAESHRKKILKFFETQNINHKTMLDVGQRSPLTELMEEKFNLHIDNTEGDLDENFKIPYNNYDRILFSSTIEHLFNPLHTLQRLKSVMRPSTKMYIITPDRGKMLWCRGHFNEIDNYRMNLLLKRAGLKCELYKRIKVWRSWKEYVFGLRPLLRLFFEFHAIYRVSISGIK